MKIIKVCLVACYIGELPIYFELFLKSCSTNINFNFLIISDVYYEKKIPTNVIFVHKSLHEIALLASKKFGFEVSLNTPYKLNDFKPAYGDIFSDYLNEYHFWGYIDIDIILGNLDVFLTYDILSEFDTIAVRSEYMTGFFSLFKNSKFFNKLYTCSKDYRKIYQSPNYYGFDECNFLWLPLCAGESILNYNTGVNCIESISHIIRKYELEGLIKPYFDTHAIEEIYSQTIVWEHGSLLIGEFEVILYHLILYKKMPYTVFPNWKSIPNVFHIYELFFFHFDESIIYLKLRKFYYQCRKNFITSKNLNIFLIKSIWSQIINFNRCTDEDNMSGVYAFERQIIKIFFLYDRIYLEYSPIAPKDGQFLKSKLSLLFKINNNTYISRKHHFTLLFYSDFRGQNTILLSYINYNFNCLFTKIE